MEGSLLNNLPIEAGKLIPGDPQMVAHVCDHGLEIVEGIVTQNFQGSAIRHQGFALGGRSKDSFDGPIKNVAKIFLRLLERFLGRFLLGDVLSEDGDADLFPIDNNGVESQVQGAAANQQRILNPKRALGESPLIKRRPKHRPLRLKHIVEAHPRRELDAKSVLNGLLQSSIECNQAIIEVHRPNQVFGAFDQGREIGFSLIGHFGLPYLWESPAPSIENTHLGGGECRAKPEGAICPESLKMQFSPFQLLYLIPGNYV